MSPVRAILLHSPGYNEGKARYETLGKHQTKKLRAPLGAALLSEHWSYVSEVPPLKGLNKCASMIKRGCGKITFYHSPLFVSSYPRLDTLALTLLQVYPQDTRHLCMRFLRP